MVLPKPFMGAHRFILLVDWTVTPAGYQCFDLLSYVLLKAFVGCLLAKGQSLMPHKKKALGVASHLPLYSRIGIRALPSMQICLDSWGIRFRHWF